ncbi:MAG TPA: ankyrin repeat domain-containing protein [Pyrinomonadaceae bacterium]|nr:ankyrin repeat domain-containing protein [Pyrinomonadaceae bacterium]
MAPKTFLKNLTVASPCNADWNLMTGNDQVRFCEHCSFEVHNLSSMSRTEAERLVTRSNGRLCVQYIQDPNGGPVTIPVGKKLHHINRRVSQIAAGAFTAALSVTSAIAQESTGVRVGGGDVPRATQPIARWALGASVVGTVTDQNGAAIPGATLSVSNEEFNLALYASTSADGRFRIDGLRAGSYNLRIEAPGFAADESNGIYVSQNAELRMDRSLKVAAIEENVEIELNGETRFISSGGMVAYVAPEHPFVRAAQEDDLETLAGLISGMDVNLRDPRSKTTALEHAVRNANREMVQLLLSSGAKVNLKNSAGQTVLMMLDADATSDLMWDLINAGAKVNLKDDGGSTALMQAATANNLEALKALLDAGAELNTTNKGGRTALMLAASEGHVNIVRNLVLAGADINLSDEDKMNALAHALENDHAAVVRFLRSKGAVEAVAKVKKEEEEE